MTLDDYREAWQRQDAVSREEVDEDELLARVRERSEAFDRGIRRRDLLETVAAVAVAAFFGYEAVTATTGLARIGAVILVASAGFIVWWLRRARTAGPPASADLSVADRLRAERQRMDVQIRLLETVAWWYLAPPAVGLALFIVGLRVGTTATLASLALVIVTFTAVWYVNRRAVRRDLRPRRKELTRRLEALEEDEG